LRVTPQEEEHGLDLGEHDTVAYPEFVAAATTVPGVAPLPGTPVTAPAPASARGTGDWTSGRSPRPRTGPQGHRPCGPVRSPYRRPRPERRCPVSSRAVNSMMLCAISRKGLRWRMAVSRSR